MTYIVRVYKDNQQIASWEQATEPVPPRTAEPFDDATPVYDTYEAITQRLRELMLGKWAVVELRTRSGRKRSIRGDVVAISGTGFAIIDKPGREHRVIVSEVIEAIVNPGGNGDGIFTAIKDGEIVR